MASRACPHCGEQVASQFVFCGHCGSALEKARPDSAPPPPPPPPSGPAPTADGPGSRGSSPSPFQVVVLRGPVPEGSVYSLRPGRNVVGRKGDISFRNDPSIDAKHLVLRCSNNHVEIAEVPGASGGYRRIQKTIQVDSGDIIFAGEQYLVIRDGNLPQDAVPLPGEDVPEETFGTPLPPPRLHVTQLLGKGLPGRVASTDKPSLTIGREGSDLSFPHDRFMSGRHLRVDNDNGQLSVTDVGSLNGTFTRVIKLPQRLNVGDEVMIGAVLFRIDYA